MGSTLDSTTLQTLPTAGRNPFFLATITPGVTHTGDPQFIRQQDQTNSSLLSLGGGPRRGNNYTLDGVSIVDIAQPRHDHPVDRGGGGSQGPGHARTTRRWAAPAAASST